MSTRWYPLYQRGNPQLRIFLPNFWMKLVKPELTAKSSMVEFHCSMEMTKHDIKNYLEKIYNVPVIKVNTRIALGKTRKNELGTIVKDDDIKIAYVQLPRTESFTFPNLFDNEMKKKDKDSDENAVENSKKEFVNQIKESQRTRPGIPPWFSI